MAMEAAIAEIDGQPGCHPHEKPYPRQARQTGHQIATEDDTKYRHQGNPGGAEWAVDFRLDRPENPDAQTHQYEGEQSADIGQLGNFLDRKQGMTGGIEWVRSRVGTLLKAARNMPSREIA